MSLTRILKGIALMWVVSITLILLAGGMFGLGYMATHGHPFGAFFIGITGVGVFLGLSEYSL